MKKSTRQRVSRKLKLRTETIRALEVIDLARAVGGDASFEPGVNCPQRAAESGNINCPSPARVPAPPGG